MGNWMGVDWVGDGLDAGILPLGTIKLLNGV